MAWRGAASGKERPGRVITYTGRLIGQLGGMVLGQRGRGGVGAWGRGMGRAGRVEGSGGLSGSGREEGKL